MTAALQVAGAARTSPHLIGREQLLQRVRELPPLPQAAMAALAAVRDDNTSTERCSDLIGRDQALAARTLRLANSAFYGVPGRVGSTRDAVHLLGRRPLSSMITLATLGQQFSASHCPLFSSSAFWRHSVAVALAARGVANALERDDDQAFTLGLLHDVGRLALAAHFPLQLTAAIRRQQESDSRLPEIEREVLGTDHADVGAQVAQRWNFPAEMVRAIASHHAPAAASGGAASLADIVHVADAMAHALDLAGDADEVVPLIDSAAWNRLALAPRTVLQIFQDTESGVTALCQAMGL